jgi:Leucine-rich repeat (LRR) protein
MNIFNGSHEIEYINLWNNFLTQLNVTTFHNLHNLKEIDLSRNRIKQLNSAIFSGLNKLEKIYLHGNEFESDLLKLCLELSVKFISFKKDYEHNDFDSIIFSN